jgi:hypothetical protein
VPSGRSPASPDALLIEGAYDEHAIVLDWKDMWKLPAQTEIGLRRLLPAAVLRVPDLRELPDGRAVTLREFYVRYSEPREATLHEGVGRRHRAEISALPEQFDRCVEENLWVPSPGAHCTYCPMPQKCPIHPEARGSGRITTPEEAMQTAAEFVVAQAIVKQKREQLGPWVRDERAGAGARREGPQGGRVVGYQPDENRIGKFHGPDSGAPRTEREAAILAYPNSGTARRRVLDHIAASASGATDEEISLALDMRLYTAAPRRNELLNDGWICDSGKTRPTTTGTRAVVWVLTQKGREQWRSAA